MGAISSLKCQSCSPLETEALVSLELFGFLSSARWLVRKPGGQAGKKQPRSPTALDIPWWIILISVNKYSIRIKNAIQKKKNLRSFIESEMIVPFDPRRKNKQMNMFLGIGCY